MKRITHIQYGRLLFAISASVIFAGANVEFLHAAALSRETYPSVKEGIVKKIDETISQDSEAIFSDKDALFSYVKRFGPRETTLHLHKLSARYGDCHHLAHEAGRFAYEIYGDKAFQACSAECHSGCYHGAIEAYFKENGTADLAENIKTLCSGELNSFFSHQCFHGIGHGLMAWTNYKLFEALEACNLLPERQDSCWTGVFMENIVGGLGKMGGQTTKYLSDDPHYPCNDPKLEERYRSSCYFLQTSRMMQLFPGDFSRMAQECAKALSQYRSACFASMGREVGGVTRSDHLAALAACQHALAGEMRISCLAGVAQDYFWDPSGQERAIEFCKLLADKNEKDTCYSTLFWRAHDIIHTRNDRNNFCGLIEAGYQDACYAAVKN